MRSILFAGALNAVALTVRVGERPPEPKPVVPAAQMCLPEVQRLHNSLDGFTWTEPHWPAARRREAQAIERFQLSEHALWSHYEMARLEAGRHGRVRAETYAELQARAVALKEENTRFEERLAKEAVAARTLGAELQAALESETDGAPADVRKLGALLQQALIERIDGPIGEQVVVRLHLSAAGLARGVGGVQADVLVRDVGDSMDDEADATEVEPPPPPRPSPTATPPSRPSPSTPSELCTRGAA